MSLANSFDSFFDIDPMMIPSHNNQLRDFLATFQKNKRCTLIFLEKTWKHYYDTFYIGNKEDPEGKIFKEVMGFDKLLLPEELIKWPFSRGCRPWYHGDKAINRFGNKETLYYPNSQQKIKEQWWKLRDILLEAVKFEEKESLVSTVQGLEYDEAFFTNIFYETLWNFKDEKLWKEYQEFGKEKQSDVGNSALHLFRFFLLAKFNQKEYNSKYKKGTAFLVWLIQNSVDSLDFKKVA